jgi:hypothetical protein
MQAGSKMIYLITYFLWDKIVTLLLFVRLTVHNHRVLSPARAESAVSAGHTGLPSVV